MTSWEEKYRPKTLNEVAGQSDSVRQLKDYIKKGDAPHMLFIGPPGTGKTSAAYAFARDYLGDDFGVNVLEINASDERGLDIVRDRIIPFARSLPFGGPRRIVILDEADGLTQEAQAALHRPLEKFGRNCLFVLTANSAKIDMALWSRLAVFEFGPIEAKAAAVRMLEILKNEGIEATLEDLETIAREADGDLRKVIQSVRRFVSVPATQEVTIP